MTTPECRFALESLAACRAEAQPLLEAHWGEIAHYQDIPLNVDWPLYEASARAGIVRIFTVRDASSRLIGYAAFFVRPGLHYRGSVQAIQDVLYLDPPYRKVGVGRRFLAWCDAQLRAEGVQVVYHHVKLSYDFGPLLAELGYAPIETVWGRRLDQESV